MDQLEKLTKYIVQNLVSDPESVSVKVFDDEDEIIIQVLASTDEMGAIIGRSGKTASAIRTLVQATSYARGEKRVKINFDSI